MPILSAYREAVSEGLAECRDINRLQKLGLVALIVLSERQARVDERNLLVAPSFDSVGAIWHDIELDEDVLYKELKEILGES